MAKFFTSDLLLHERIAAGGMGEIYRATQTGAGKFSKTVAVKRILSGLSDNEMFLKMFDREAAISSRLNHPNILQVYRSGQTSEGLYLVMELVDGQSIERLLRKLGERNLLIPPALCCLIMAEAAKGLDFAHSLTDPETGKSTPVVHRDISPSNLMISYNGEVKLLDFGFAKISDMSSLTNVGELKGKAAYFAPEVITGSEATPQSDLFSLGTLFFELLSGAPLFRESTPMLAMAKIEKCEIPPLSDFRPDPCPELERVVKLLLQKDPRKRLHSAKDLHRLLAQLLADTYAGTMVSDLGDFMKTLFSDEIRKMKEQRSIDASKFTASMKKERMQKRLRRARRAAISFLLVVCLPLIAYAVRTGKVFAGPQVSVATEIVQDRQVSASAIGALPGLVGWYSAEEVPGANDTLISVWKDQSAKHHDLFQPESRRQPHIRRSSGAQRCTMLFDGNASAMEDDTIAASLTSANGVTVFYVTRAYGGSGAQSVWSLRSKEKGQHVLIAGFSPDGRTARLQSDALPGRILDSDPILPQDLGCYRVSVGDNSLSLTQNGVTILSHALQQPLPFQSAASFSLGEERDKSDRSTNFLRGDISEMLIFDRKIGDEQVALVERYLRDRYGCGLQGR
ncbi:MAG: serine/threonine-protein kinase [Bdellovibrionota bacterium]